MLWSLRKRYKYFSCFKTFLNFYVKKIFLGLQPYDLQLGTLK